jgi:2-C-methyl-D-erythritol 4-phosphate cytidylyltransferase
VSLVEELVLSALSIGASGPVRPLVSTILKSSANSTLEASLNRNAYCASETPQAFRFEVIFSAYNKVKILF